MGPVTFKRIQWLAAGILSIALLAGGWILFDRNTGHGQQRTLPDGSVLTLVQVDFGTNNVFTDGNAFQKIFQNVIPERGVGILGRRIERGIATTNQAAEPQLVLWIKHSFLTPWPPNPSSAGSMGPLQDAASDWIFNTRAFASDDLGHQYEAASMWMSDYSKTNPVSEWTFPAFPRNGKLIHVQIQRRTTTNPRQLNFSPHDTWKPFAEFQIPNPAPKESESDKWAPSALPVSQKTGSTEFTLIGVTAGKASDPSNLIRTNELTRLAFQIRENGRLTRDWAACAVSIREAGGNHYEWACFHTPNQFLRPMMQDSGSTEGQLVEIPCVLDVQRPWKVRVEFIRTNSFPTEALWTCTKVPLPSGWTATPILSTNVFRNVVDCTIDPNRFIVSLPTKPPGYCVRLIKLQDDQGRDLLEGDIGGDESVTWGETPENQHSVERMFQPKPSAIKSLDFTAAVLRTVPVEFIVRPEPILTNKSTVAK
jgi:hypothetical protein